jgi:hypothetical protein
LKPVPTALKPIYLAGRGREKTQNGIETPLDGVDEKRGSNVEAGRKPRTGLKRCPVGICREYFVRRGREKTQNGIETVFALLHGGGFVVEAGRKPRTGLKHEAKRQLAEFVESRQGENPERD